MRRKTSLAVFLALLAVPALAASGGVVDPFANSTIPSHVRLVGLGTTGPDSSLGQATCTIRNIANVPVPGTLVTLDFSSCSDLSIASDQLDPRLFTDCSARTVSAVADVNGVARFTIIGTGTHGSPHLANGLDVFADGIFLGSTSVAVLERDGTGGLTLADLSFWAADYFSGTNLERADLDGVPGVNLIDLSLWAIAYFSGNNGYTAGPYCP